MNPNRAYPSTIDQQTTPTHSGYWPEQCGGFQVIGPDGGSIARRRVSDFAGELFTPVG